MSDDKQNQAAPALAMAPEVKARWMRGAELEARFGLGPGCPPTMTKQEMDAWDARELRGENPGQRGLPNDGDERRAELARPKSQPQ